MLSENLTEIFFSFYSDLLDQETTETLQAEVTDEEKGYYKIKDIPFYIPKIAAGDIIWAEYGGAEPGLSYRATVHHSGNSTVHIIILDTEYGIAAVRAAFEETGCRTRIYNDNYFAVNILAAIAYPIIQNRLVNLEKESIINYAESHLSEKHQADMVSGF